jgi:hypothetical protein
MRSAFSPDRMTLPVDSALLARGAVAKKISPVIARNLQANRGFLENITGNNRCPPSAMWRRVPMPARIFSMRALRSGKTPNVAPQMHAHKRTNVRFQKIVGTKLESLTQISGEYFCASGGYEADVFSKLFFYPASIEISMLISIVIRTVVYTERGESIRIVSARRATKIEHDDYYRQNAKGKACSRPSRRTRGGIVHAPCPPDDCGRGGRSGKERFR